MPLNEHFAEIETGAEEAQLSENALKRIAKAKRVVVKMAATIAFFWHTLKAKVEALDLAPQVEQAVYDHLIQVSTCTWSRTRWRMPSKDMLFRITRRSCWPRFGPKTAHFVAWHQKN